MARPRKRQPLVSARETDSPGLDVNAVVSYNVRAIRERHGWTQQRVADALATLTGHAVPQNSISAMERGFDGDRRRRFDAHELYLLSQVFDVPIAYFFIPPPESDQLELADTRRPLDELYEAVIGTDDNLEPLDERLRQIAIENPEQADALLATLLGSERAAGNWRPHFRTWRRSRLRELAMEHGDDLDGVVDFLAQFADKVKHLGPDGYLQSVSYRAGDAILDAPAKPGPDEAED